MNGKLWEQWNGAERVKSRTLMMTMWMWMCMWMTTMRVESMLLQTETPHQTVSKSEGLRHLAHNGHIKGRSLRLPGVAISLLGVYIAGHDIGGTTVAVGYKENHNHTIFLTHTDLL